MLHLHCSDPECRLLASSSKDSTVRIWDTILCKVVLILSGHTHCVTCVQWGGEGLLYTSSQDRSIKVWRAIDVCTIIISSNSSRGLLPIFGALACKRDQAFN